MRLPAIMEDILEAWEKAKPRPQFKAEYIVTHAITGSLAEGARVTAARLKMNKDETEALVERFVGYAQELRGPNVKPVPPFLFEISKDSRDHSREVYEEVIMPGFRRMNPAPKIALTRFGAGVHSFWKAEKDLPVGIAPSVLRTGTTRSLAVISHSGQSRVASDRSCNATNHRILAPHGTSSSLGVYSGCYHRTSRGNGRGSFSPTKTASSFCRLSPRYLSLQLRRSESSGISTT